MRIPFTLLCFFVSYASSQCQTLETVLQKGHELAVIAVAISPDSNYVATGSRDKTAKLWEVRSGREVRSFLGHEASVNALDFSSDGKYLITSGGDKTARIWEVATGKELYKTEAADKLLTDVAISNNNQFFIVAGYPDTASVYDMQTKKLIAKLPVNADQGRGYGVNIAISKNN
nr:hypothetical protein [Cyclobacteriaceae bacterium]